MLNNGAPIKLDEKERIYTYPGGDKVTLRGVRELIVSKSGNHRLKAVDGLHIVPPGWIHVHIPDGKEWTI